MAENVSLLTLPVLVFTDAEGTPLPGAKLYSYEAGTSTPKALYADQGGTAALPNPAIADADGKLVAYSVTDAAYKLDLFDANDVHQPHWPIDNYLDLSFTAASFTPVIEGTTTPGVGTYQNAFGFIYRVGPLVFYTLYLECVAHTGTGNLVVRGFPILAAVPSVAPVIISGTGLVLQGPAQGLLRHTTPAPTLEVYAQNLATGVLGGVDLPAAIAATTTFFIHSSGTYIGT